MQQAGTLQKLAIQLRDRTRKDGWAENSRSTYNSCFGAWEKYASIVGLSPRGIDIKGDPIPSEVMKVHVINYVTVQVAVRGLAPSSVRTVYLPAIKWKFDSEGWEDTISRAVDAKEVKQVLRGFQRFYYRHNPTSERLKLA
jgi:hypothetical protein